METNFANLEEAHSLISRQRVLQDLKILARDAEDLLKVTAGDVGEKGRELTARLQGALSRARSVCAELQEQAIASAKTAARNTDAMIRDHPYETIGIAFGFGVLIGLLAARE